MDKLDTKEIPEKPESIFLRISLKNHFMLEKLKIYEKGTFIFRAKHIMESKKIN